MIRSLKCPLLPLLALTLLIFSSARAQQAYDSHWKKIAALESKGLYQTAAGEAERIYLMAKAAHNNPQLIRALIYELKYRGQLEENAEVKNIDGVAAEIGTAGPPVKNLLQSMLAEMYWNYLQQNRFRLYGRTTIQSYTPEDMQTWSADQLNKKIAELYLLSLENENTLKRTRIGDYDSILVRGKNTEGLRPTLYDLLAHRALDYFTNEERTVMQPAYRFEIADPRVFSPAAEFAARPFPAKDTVSLFYRAIGILQGLIRFHLRDAGPGALVDADLQRLQFMYQHSIPGNKDSLYRAALEEIERRYEQSPVSAQSGYLSAQLLYQSGSKYQPLKDTAHQFDIKSAKEICEKEIKKFPHSEGGINCASLLRTILRPYVDLQTEKVNIPGQPFRTLVSYKNALRIYFRLAQIPENYYDKISRVFGKDYWKELLQQPASRNWSVQFPGIGDYQQHAAEMKIDALPAGNYMLIASNDSSFSVENNLLAAQFFFVSAISYVKDDHQNYFVLNRETGQPLPGAKVQVWENKYDYTARQNVFFKTEAYTTDATGYFKIKDTGNFRNIRLEFTWQKDHLFTDDYQHLYRNAAEEPNKGELKPKTFLFTDRSVYRPGQAIYFKGIVLATDAATHLSRVKPGFKTAVYLYDVNGQATDSVSVTTNEFGSYAGSFRLPEGGLNGQMLLRDGGTLGETYFSVEEYKRPKFYVEMEKLKEAYRLGDSIRVTGAAKSYAGANIAGAMVKYRVVRRDRVPYPWAYPGAGPILRASDQMEITQGETTTDADGKFTLRFKAIPDKTIPEDQQPVFDYSVEADVTDINGETRSGQMTVPVGYRSLELSLNIPDKVEVDSLQNLFVSTTNLSGEFEPALIRVSLYKLREPDHFIRKRYWQQPDQFVISREEYHKYFPTDEYRDENDPATWGKAHKAWEVTTLTAPGRKLPIGSEFNTGSKFSNGWYAIEATGKDKYGKEVKEVKYIQVYDDKMSSLPFKAMAWDAPLKLTAAPGEKGSFLLATAAKDLYVIQQVSRMNGKGQFSAFRLSEEVKRIDLPADENDRGGIVYRYLFVKDNRVYTGNEVISVPWDNKQLKITYETFRDKMLPGSKEQWKLKITGYKGEKIAAEMLASMYDASLDAFRFNSWTIPDLYPTPYGGAAWSGSGDFTAVNAQQYFQGKITGNSLFYEKRYDYLNWFGYLHPARIMIRGVSAMSAQAAGDNNRQTETQELAVMPAPPVNAAVPPAPVQLRTNLQETAFFFPQLQTDREGNVIIDFTMPEALTRWKFMAFAHTKDMAYAFSQKEVVTQKQLMVIPNPPRFLREGDKIVFTAKVSNLSAKPLNGEAKLQLLDAATLQPVNGLFKNNHPGQGFTVAAGQSAALSWQLDIPEDFHSVLTYRVVATAGDYSDGEGNALPVLTNRMLVTETLPLPVRTNVKKEFKFEKLLHSKASATLSNYGLTVEFTGNPAWYAVQALPYLSEASNECAEQIFNRYYASALAAHIARSSPKMAEIFKKWEDSDTAALMSNLQKNEELKSALLRGTPWVMEAKNETERKHRLALLFDSRNSRNGMDKALQQLQQMQTPNGGFSWFTGMPDDRFITQYIVTGIGHLQHLRVGETGNNEIIRQLLDKAIPYLDARLKEDFDNRVKENKKPDRDHAGNIQIQYLYMRSFFKDRPVPKEVQAAFSYYRSQAKKYWPEKNKYMQGMIALALDRDGDRKTAAGIIRSLKETAIHNWETGMYWKEMSGGYYWYEAPVETESLLIEAFREIAGDENAIGEMKTWLLKQKQTQNWKTTKATADAVYALLLEGEDWLSAGPEVTIQLGDSTVRSTEQNEQAGTGYFSKHFESGQVEPAMGNITVSVSSPEKGGLAWGAAYWQYFEQLDKISSSVTTPFSLKKELFIEKNTDRGPVLAPVTASTPLKTGDRVKVRMELRCNRDMEYVHLKDMRAACFEPVQALSGYRWQSGAGYYESAGDVSTDFFFNRLPRGTYVFEYPVFVTGKGDFSNGISTVQCLYAPEFSSHSGGIRVVVK